MDLSIIIPCYNSGAFLNEALESIGTSKGLLAIAYEVIIVDDGSTETFTTQLLDKLDVANYQVISQENKGPASARNTGVKNAKAQNLLFLDSDNKLAPEFITTGLKILTNTNADIVYGKPLFFGDATRKTFTPGPFDMNSILLTNYIDMCSMIRKSVWEGVGGFDEARIMIGFEDWEFWIRAGAAGYNFHYVDKVLYHYRINNSSLLAEKNVTENYDKVVDYVYGKHARMIQNAYRNLYPQFLIYKRDQTLPIRSFFKFFYMKYIKPFFDLEKKGFRTYKQN